MVEDVESVDLSTRPFVVRGTETTVRAHSLIIATGATARRLGIPSEDRFWSAGISACAICDGASPIFKGQVRRRAGWEWTSDGLRQLLCDVVCTPSVRQRR